MNLKPAVDDLGRARIPATTTVKKTAVRDMTGPHSRRMTLGYDHLPPIMGVRQAKL